jgi:hypothetical protein
MKTILRSNPVSSTVKTPGDRNQPGIAIGAKHRRHLDSRSDRPDPSEPVAGDRQSAYAENAGHPPHAGTSSRAKPIETIAPLVISDRLEETAKSGA